MAFEGGSSWRPDGERSHGTATICGGPTPGWLMPSPLKVRPLGSPHKGTSEADAEAPVSSGTVRCLGLDIFYGRQAKGPSVRGSSSANLHVTDETTTHERSRLVLQQRTWLAPPGGRERTRTAPSREEEHMLDFIGTNWIWILLIGGMLFMHLGHGGHGGHGGSDAEGQVTQTSGEPRH